MIAQRSHARFSRQDLTNMVRSLNSHPFYKELLLNGGNDSVPISRDLPLEPQSKPGVDEGKGQFQTETVAAAWFWESTILNSGFWASDSFHPSASSRAWKKVGAGRPDLRALHGTGPLTAAAGRRVRRLLGAVDRSGAWGEPMIKQRGGPWGWGGEQKGLECLSSAFLLSFVGGVPKS